MPLEINKFEKIVNKNTLGVPRTPGSWHSDPDYENVTVLTVDGSLGYTGCHGKEIVKQIPYEALQNGFVELTTYDGRRIVLNTRYIVKVEDFTMVAREYNSQNPNYEKGIYTCRWLLPLGFAVDWSDNFDSF